MTEIEFIETYMPALQKDLPAVASPAIEFAKDKIALARAMYSVRSDFIMGMSERAVEWIDNTAAMTQAGQSNTLFEAIERYRIARESWSQVFALKIQGARNGA